jgi:hypothetical protein
MKQLEALCPSGNGSDQSWQQMGGEDFGAAGDNFQSLASQPLGRGVFSTGTGTSTDGGNCRPNRVKPARTATRDRELPAID